MIGATAGGAYLLSAKQRYNERVKTSVKGLLQVEEFLKNGDSKSAKAYFDGEDAGSWKDLTAAGYLLSNAFRRTASKAPDSLPSVQVRTHNTRTMERNDVVYLLVSYRPLRYSHQLIDNHLCFVVSFLPL